METLERIITEKYFWRPEYQLAMRWADVASNEGVDAISLVNFVASKLFEKAGK